MKDLRSELGGHLEEVILGLMYPPAQYDAIWLRKSMKVHRLYLSHLCI